MIRLAINIKMYTTAGIWKLSIMLVAAFFVGITLKGQQTEKIYLSGTGSEQTVNWEFFCTGGMNSGKWTQIAVPSCWELQGFGKYDYGFAKDSLRGKEHGLYRHRFSVPSSWKGRTIHIVFEGVMTDAAVKVNGRPAGEVHQGAFYAFKYNISSLLKYGRENLLEVNVAKHSANESVNAAERRADFWIFGGVFRPVWLEVLPSTHITGISIDGKANGELAGSFSTNRLADPQAAVKIFDGDGNLVDSLQAVNVGSNKSIYLFSRQIPRARQWNPESPILYTAEFSIYSQGKLVHKVSRKFGFRTVELKARDGIYVNGVKVKLKGVNRHSFRPETGRTTSRQNSIDDVLLMKDMNMNAVRMSHYPPDDHFLDACDSLGLFVMDELAGWHGHYDTPTGRKLLKEMIDHDARHPSVIIWANGNEGGHNFELDSLFYAYDIQKRSVVHPWQLFNGIETQHYREYNYGIGNYENGREIILPTEFLHGQFDGGHGAGLEDYWEKMWRDPLSAGGFLWDFADNAVVRRDRNDSLDTDKDRAADGILGPHHEKEGSYYAIKEIWSPVYFEKRYITPGFDGKLNIENRYHYTNLDQCSFSWQLTRFGVTDLSQATGGATAPVLRPGEKGILQLDLPGNWKDFDALYVTANDRYQKELFTWSFPITPPAVTATRMVRTTGDLAIGVTDDDTMIRVAVGDVRVSFSKRNGLLSGVRNEKGLIPFLNGPVIDEGATNYNKISYRMEGPNLVISSVYDRETAFNTIQWTIYPSGWIRLHVRYFPAAYFTNYTGLNFSFPEDQIRSVTYLGNGPYRVWKNRMKGNRFGVWSKNYNSTETGEYPWLYPEFRGYHSDFYGGYFFTRDDNRFTVVSATEGLFLRLFTPAWKTDQWHNYEPLFPSGDISFMQGISSIGTKTQRNETTGPMGGRNIFYDYEKDPGRALDMILYFNFSASQR